MWILLKQETVSGSGISWAICMSASRSREITTPAPHDLVFYRPDALPATFKREQKCKETPYGTTCLTALFSRTTRVRRILLKLETVSGSGTSWATCKCVPPSRQITMPAPHHSVFTGRMPFLPPNQQHQSIEGKKRIKKRDVNSNKRQKKK